MKKTVFSVTEAFLPGAGQQRRERLQRAVDQYLALALKDPPPPDGPMAAPDGAEGGGG